MPEEYLQNSQNEKQHWCGVYRDPRQEAQAAAEFLLAGIRDVNKCVLFGQGGWVKDVLHELGKLCPDLEAKIANRQVVSLNPQECFLVNGAFSADRALSFLEQFYCKVESESFTGLYWAADQSWVLKGFNIWDELFIFESKVNKFASGKKIKFLCLYDPARISAKYLWRALSTHPNLQNEHFSGPCPNYLPPEEFAEEERKSHFGSQDANRTGPQLVVVEQRQPSEDKTVGSQFVDQIKDSVLVVSGQGVIQFMNKEAQSRYGNQVNRVCHESVFRSVRPCPVCQVTKLVAEGKDKIETEFQDEHGAHLALVAYRASLANQEEGVLVYLRDVTQKKKWEEESAFLDKFSSLGYLASGIAHELNNNLTPILICSQMLSQADLSDSLKEKAKKIETSAVASKKLVESLQDFSQKIPHKKDYANLNEIVQKILSLMEVRLTSANIKVILKLDPTLPATLVDELKIQQVFSHLITNAYQAMQEGGGKIVITSSHTSGWCKFEVADTGPGIPQGIRSKIFDPFFTTRQFGDGSGLGLSTCFGIVVAHQGKLHFQTKENVGSTFIVELPVIGGETADPVWEKLQKDSKEPTAKVPVSEPST